MKATLADYLDDWAAPEQPALSKSHRGQPRAKRKTYPPDTDIMLWLRHNAPANFAELIDIRYSLYHRCSKAGYQVKRLNDDELTIAGRHSSLHIVSNQARRLLLTKLRELAKENGWQGALPRRAGRRPKESGSH